MAEDEKAGSITTRSLNAIKSIGRNTTFFFKKEKDGLEEAEVSLRPISKESFWDICKLKVAPIQEQYVADNVVSIAEAYFSDKAWFRGIYADDLPVGFLMLSDDSIKSRYHLWRIMVDEEFQRQGYARQAFKLLVDHVKTLPGATKIESSYVDGKGSPKEFFTAMNFVHTGHKVGKETGVLYYL